MFWEQRIRGTFVLLIVLLPLTLSFFYIYRTGENLVKLDICDPEQVEKVVEEFKPSAIVHCAAQRFPDKVEKDLEGTMKLNVEATGKMAVLAGIQLY